MAQPSETLVHTVAIADLDSRAHESDTARLMAHGMARQSSVCLQNAPNHNRPGMERSSAMATLMEVLAHSTAMTGLRFMVSSRSADANQTVSGVAVLYPASPETVASSVIHQMDMLTAQKALLLGTLAILLVALDTLLPKQKVSNALA